MDRFYQFNQEAWQQLREIQGHSHGANSDAASKLLLDSTMLCFKADALIANISTCIRAGEKCRHDANLLVQHIKIVEQERVASQGT
jgi:hypothetical protein